MRGVKLRYIPTNMGVIASTVSVSEVFYFERKALV